MQLSGTHAVQTVFETCISVSYEQRLRLVKPFAAMIFMSRTTFEEIENWML